MCSLSVGPYEDRRIGHGPSVYRCVAGGSGAKVYDGRGFQYIHR